MEDRVVEHDALNWGSGAHGRHRRRGFRPRCPTAQRQPKTPGHSMMSPPSSLPYHPVQILQEGHRRVSCRSSCIAASAATPSGRAHGTGLHLAARITLPHAEAVASRRHQPWHSRPTLSATASYHGARLPRHRAPPLAQWAPDSVVKMENPVPQACAAAPPWPTPPAPPLA